MKLKICCGGIDSVLCDIKSRLNDALKAKSKAEKDKDISRALGNIEAMFRLLEECEEELENYDEQEGEDGT